jgi:hypothetical protein
MCNQRVWPHFWPTTCVRHAGTDEQCTQNCVARTNVNQISKQNPAGTSKTACGGDRCQPHLKQNKVAVCVSCYPKQHDATCTCGKHQAVDLSCTVVKIPDSVHACNAMCTRCSSPPARYCLDAHNAKCGISKRSSGVAVVPLLSRMHTFNSTAHQRQQWTFTPSWQCPSGE